MGAGKGVIISPLPLTSWPVRRITPTSAQTSEILMISEVCATFNPA